MLLKINFFPSLLGFGGSLVLWRRRPPLCRLLSARLLLTPCGSATRVHPAPLPPRASYGSPSPGRSLGTAPPLRPAHHLPALLFPPPVCCSGSMARALGHALLSSAVRRLGLRPLAAGPRLLALRPHGFYLPFLFSFLWIFWFLLALDSFTAASSSATLLLLVLWPPAGRSLGWGYWRQRGG